MFLDCSPNVLGVSTLKRCYACGQWQTFDAYNVDKSRRDGLQPKCKTCHAAYRAANADRIAQYKREHKAIHAEQYKERAKQYYAEHAAEIDEYQKQYRAKNADKRRAYTSQYRLTDKGRAVERATTERRRAREKGAAGSFTTADIEAIRVAQGNRCYICHKKLTDYHIDHFIPLAKGGTNDPGNLRLACPKCNNSKRAKHPHELGILL